MTKNQLNTALTRCNKVLKAAKYCCGLMYVDYDYGYFDGNGKGRNGSWSLEIELRDLNTSACNEHKISGDDDPNQLIFKPVFDELSRVLSDMDLECGVYSLNPGNYSIIEVD